MVLAVAEAICLASPMSGEPHEHIQSTPMKRLRDEWFGGGGVFDGSIEKRQAHSEHGPIFAGSVQD